VIASLNMHCLKNEGTTFATSAARAAAVAKKVKSLGVDVLVAQEVCTRSGQGGESMEAHLNAALRAETGAAWESRLTYVHDAWVGTPDEAREHLGVFSRQPLGEARPLLHRVQGALSRQALAVRVSPRGAAPIDVVDVHFDHANADVRTAQARDVAVRAVLDAPVDGAGKATVSALVLGDYNARAGASSHAALASGGFVALGGSIGLTRIDHALLHRSAPYAEAGFSIELEGAEAVSDHPMIVAVLAPRQGSPVAVTRVGAASRARALTVRGSVLPLTWLSGWPLLATSGGNVEMASTEIGQGPFELKLLEDDTAWQTGPNVQGRGGESTRVTPSFP
jgi:endonuclease/exonuclease/phosphatase family metal-dependent hydrolase